MWENVIVLVSDLLMRRLEKLRIWDREEYQSNPCPAYCRRSISAKPASAMVIVPLAPFFVRGAVSARPSLYLQP